MTIKTALKIEWWENFAGGEETDFFNFFRGGSLEGDKRTASAGKALYDPGICGVGER